MAIAVSAAFLVVASASFSPSVIASLAFATSIGTLVVSAAIAYSDRGYVAFLVTALLTFVISAWAIVASLVFSQSTVQHLALAASLAISGLALVGPTKHEVSHERAERSSRSARQMTRSRGSCP